MTPLNACPKTILRLLGVVIWHGEIAPGRSAARGHVILCAGVSDLTVKPGPPRDNANAATALPCGARHAARAREHPHGLKARTVRQDAGGPSGLAFDWMIPGERASPMLHLGFIETPAVRPRNGSDVPAAQCDGDLPKRLRMPVDPVARKRRRRFKRHLLILLDGIPRACYPLLLK